MALPLLTEQKVTAFKLEGTYGTAEALTTAEATSNIFETEMKKDANINRRKGQSALSPIAGAPGSVMQRTTFKSELYGGTAADPPAWADLLEACGMNKSTATYTPLSGSASAKSVTIGLYQDGNVFKTAGAMGNFTMKGEAGKPVMLDWEFMGAYVADNATALLAPTYSTVIPPVFQGQTCTIGGTTYNVLDFELSPNNNVVMRPVGNIAASSFGYLGATITSRQWSLKVTIEDLLQSSKDFSALYNAGTTEALILTIGGTTHNTHSITAPKLQLNAIPNRVDKNGYQCLELSYDLIRSAAAGDDEFQVIFS